MKVLIAVPSLQLAGGVANYYRTLRRYLGDDKVYFEIGARPGEKGIRSQLARLVADFWNFHRALRDESWDLVHINPSMVRRSVVRDGLLLLIAHAHRRRVLVFFRGWDPAFFAWISARYGWLFRRVFARADGLVVLAREFRDELVRIGLRAPVFLETTVVDDALFEPAPARLCPQGAGGGPCRVLYLSRLDPEKGLPEAIEAFARTGLAGAGATLTIAGEGPERRAAEEEVARRGLAGITFAGHVGEAARAVLLRDADIYLFPTAFAEGMPNSVLEAMASGLPVITRAVGGLRDFFEDGRMGYMTESRDPAVFAGMLARLVADPALRAAMGRYNRDYARNRFAASVVAARLLEIYARVGRQAAAH